MIILKLFTVASAIVIGLISSAIAWDFIIIRNSTQKLPILYDSIDKFNISECAGKDDLCTNYSGQRLHDKCQCICSQKRSTFGFYNGQWGCTNNSIVQQHAGCQYSLQRPGGNMSERDPLFTLPVLGSHGDNNFVDNVPANNNCIFREANATFLECDGTWGNLTESNVKRKLAFQDYRQGVLYVGPYQSSSPADPSLDGRVIRIPIKCDGLTWNPSQCVAFKIKGQLTCSAKRNVIWPSLVPQTPPISTTGTSNTKNSDEDPTPAAAVIAGAVVGAAIFISLIAVIITLVICLRREKAKTNGKSNEGIEETETTGDGEVPGVRAMSIIAPYAQFSGEGIVSTAKDNPRQVEPYYQSLRHNQGPSYVNRPVVNGDDSPYEIMN